MFWKYNLWCLHQIWGAMICSGMKYPWLSNVRCVDYWYQHLYQVLFENIVFFICHFDFDSMSFSSFATSSASCPTVSQPLKPEARLQNHHHLWNHLSLFEYFKFFLNHSQHLPVTTIQSLLPHTLDSLTRYKSIPATT